MAGWRAYFRELNEAMRPDDEKKHGDPDAAFQAWKARAKAVEARKG